MNHGQLHNGIYFSLNQNSKHRFWSPPTQSPSSMHILPVSLLSIGLSSSSLSPQGLKETTGAADVITCLGQESESPLSVPFTRNALSQKPPSQLMWWIKCLTDHSTLPATRGTGRPIDGNMASNYEYYWPIMIHRLELSTLPFWMNQVLSRRRSGC